MVKLDYRKRHKNLLKILVIMSDNHHSQIMDYVLMACKLRNVWLQYFWNESKLK